MMEIYDLMGIIPKELAEEMISVLNHQQRRALAKRYVPTKRPKGYVSLKHRVKADPEKIFSAISQRRESLPGEEIIRAWMLAKKRDLLIAALDWAGIPHENGVTSQELDAITNAPPKELARLTKSLLDAGFSLEDVLIYLAVIRTNYYLEIKEFRNLVASWGGEELLPEVEEIVSLSDAEKEEESDAEDSEQSEESVNSEESEEKE